MNYADWICLLIPWVLTLCLISFIAGYMYSAYERDKQARKEIERRTPSFDDITKYGERPPQSSAGLEWNKTEASR